MIIMQWAITHHCRDIRVIMLQGKDINLSTMLYVWIAKTRYQTPISGCHSWVDAAYLKTLSISRHLTQKPPPISGHSNKMPFHSWSSVLHIQGSQLRKNSVTSDPSGDDVWVKSKSQLCDWRLSHNYAGHLCNHLLVTVSSPDIADTCHSKHDPMIDTFNKQMISSKPDQTQAPPTHNCTTHSVTRIYYLKIDTGVHKYTPCTCNRPIHGTILTMCSPLWLL